MIIENKIAWYNKPDVWLNILFVLFVSMFLFIRLFIFFRYNVDMIDTDQFFMWTGATDYAKGLFYEPRYYGQDYNTFMEPLFAVPFLLLKIPVYYALPLATHFIFAFPVLFTAFYLFFNEKKIHALIVLAVILCMPIHYDLLNSLPRGFITGLFFTSFFVVNMVNPHNMWFILINSIFSVIGYFVNPNSVLVSAPFLFYIFLHHYKNPRYYYITLPCVALFLPLDLFFNSFYREHPDYIKHMLQYRMFSEAFGENISYLDHPFAHISLFFEHNCTILLLTLLLLGICLFLYNKKAFSGFVMFICIILFSFCMGKTLEGAHWIYISLSRMYLGIPIVICLFIVVLKIPIKKYLLPLFCVPLLFSCVKLSTAESSLEREFRNENWVGVYLMTLKNSLHYIDVFKKECEINNVNFLLISSEYWLKPMLVHGGPAIYPDFPEMQETKLERRYWVRERNKNKVIKTFMILTHDYDLDKRMHYKAKYDMQKLNIYGLMIVRNNTLPMGEFIEHVKTFEFREEKN